MHDRNDLCNVPFFPASAVNCVGQEVPYYKDPTRPADLPRPADELPADVQAKSRAKYLELKRKFPHMKEARIVKKVAAFYKIKLIP